MKKAKRYLSNNWEGIKNLFKEEKYRCSAEGHISHILSDRLSSRSNGKIINKVKSIYNNIDPDAMIEMPYISRTEGRWLKDMLRNSSF